MSEVTIVINGEDSASDELDNVIDRMNQLEGESERTQGRMRGVQQESTKTSSGLSNMAKGAGVAAVAFMAFEAVRGILKGVSDTVVELNQELGRFQEEATRLDVMVNQMSESGLEATETLASMEEQIEAMATRTGTSIPVMNELMSELTLRLQSAELASANFERAMNLQAVTGRGAAEVSKALAEALGGQFGALKEAGILTVEQAEALSKMEDQGEAAAEAMRIVDDVVTDYVDTTPLAIEASDRLASGWERLKVASAEFIGVDRVMDMAARTLERLAKTTEEWTGNTFMGIRSITAEMEKLDRRADDMRRSMLKVSRTPVQIEMERRIEYVNQQYAEQIRSVESLIARYGTFAIIQGESVDLGARLRNLEAERAREIEGIRDSYQTNVNALAGEEEYLLNNLRLQRRALEATTEEERIRLEGQIKLNDIVRERDGALQELLDANGLITDEMAAQIANERFEVDLLLLMEEQERRIAALKGEQNDIDYEGIRLQERINALRADALDTDDLRLRAMLEYEAALLEIEQQGLRGQERRLALLQAEARIRDEMVRIVDNEEVANLRETEALLKRINTDMREMEKMAQEGKSMSPIRLSASDVIGADRQRDLEETLETVEALNTGFMNLSNTMSSASTMMLSLGSEEVSQNERVINQLEEQRAIRQAMGADTSDIDASVNALRTENDELRENHALMAQRMEDIGAIADSLSALSMQTGNLAKQQWDFQEASQSVVAAQDALGSAFGSALDAAGLGIKEKAKWMAAFETAQAAASLGLALAFPSPNYWAAVANHTIAAAQFGLIAGGVIGGGTASGTGGGGSGSAGSIASVNRDSMVSEAMRFQDGASSTSERDRAINISVDFGQGNAYLEDAPSIQRRIVAGIETELLSLMGDI